MVILTRMEIHRTLRPVLEHTRVLYTQEYFTPDCLRTLSQQNPLQHWYHCVHLVLLGTIWCREASGYNRVGVSLVKIRFNDVSCRSLSSRKAHRGTVCKYPIRCQLSIPKQCIYVIWSLIVYLVYDNKELWLYWFPEEMIWLIVFCHVTVLLVKSKGSGMWLNETCCSRRQQDPGQKPF